MEERILNAIEALTSRSSAPRLTEPAPAEADIETMLAAAARAPDHGRLRPWKFILVRGAARERLGNVLADTLRRRDPSTRASILENERAKPLRAPLIIAVAAAVTPDHPKIPEIEQVLSAGCAAQNIMLAAHALGFGAIWKTGAPSYDGGVKAALGLAPKDHIVGFLYVGTIDGKLLVDGRRPHHSEFVSDWVKPVG